MRPLSDMPIIGATRSIRRNGPNRSRVPLEGVNATSYNKRLAVLCYGRLAMVDIQDIRRGAKYATRADGTGDDPH